MSESTFGHLGDGIPGLRTLSVDALLDDPAVQIIVCCGSGGVGKTTTAAAIGVRAAERGRRVAVLTIDPARRLAQAMGLAELDSTPRRVEGIDATKGGYLDAMMLDMKRTFDEVVLAHTTPEQARQILENPFYIALSSSFAGTQEYMAMEKLGQLHTEAVRTGSHDLIVVDTPPSRSALDFLDAPKRLSSFLDSRLLRLLSTPARGPIRLFSVGMGMATSVLTKVIGAQVLRDVQTFVAALDSTFGGFRARAERTYRLLQERRTSFLVVAAPEPDALREASYFVERLRDDEMPLAGLVLNRMTAPSAAHLSAERSLSAAEALSEAGAYPAVAGVLRLHGERMLAAARERLMAERFGAAHPGVAVAGVPALPSDVHDLEGLREIGRHLGDE
ncbi:ArsA family ATPase [Thermasporomyces composti]|uniref:Arsenite efflux ATP-binding protein ArsA n=1 Tax=Thermasporomyces composti TaxID=696763 RepID=A0A3D9V4S3_THECX|nr:ArsA-related P-loop ATPase [Thermasporomyces composti]REF36822.1 arsenite efflux ATP-binding protein ArsA [Thermasporomyces composti]